MKTPLGTRRAAQRRELVASDTTAESMLAGWGGLAFGSSRICSDAAAIQRLASRPAATAVAVDSLRIVTFIKTLQ
jgi:hypothetical protein